MPKEKESRVEFLTRMTRTFPDKLRTDKQVLFCKICNILISGTKLFNVKQHFETAKHKEQEKRNENKSQKLLSEYSNNQVNPFNMDLCKMLVGANIPLNKISNPVVIEFLQKHTNCTVPSLTSLRTKYIPILYKNCLEKLRLKAHGKHIWISVDETTDVEQRLIVNFIFGIMSDNEEERGKSYILNVGVVEAANAANMTAFVIDSLHLLWPEGIQYEKVLLVVTDAAAYMLAAMKSMQTIFPKLLHVTCFAHGLHRIAEFIRFQFKNVNSLISATKAVYAKAPSRRHAFKKALPNLKLPPQPCVTRWGTWLDAAEYYCDNFKEVRSVIDNLTDEESEAVNQAKLFFADPAQVSNLSFITTNFKCIKLSIEKLQAKGLSLNDSISIVEHVKKQLNSLQKKEYFEKYNSVFKRNVGYNSLVEIKNAIFHNAPINDDYVKKLSPSEICCFKFVPCTSSDVERSFSTYGNLLTDLRRSFSVENLKHYIIVHCNIDILQ